MLKRSFLLSGFLFCLPFSILASDAGIEEELSIPGLVRGSLSVVLDNAKQYDFDYLTCIIHNSIETHIENFLNGGSYNSEDTKLLAKAMPYALELEENVCFIPKKALRFSQVNQFLNQKTSLKRVVPTEFLTKGQMTVLAQELGDPFEHLTAITGLSHKDALQHLFAQSPYALYKDFDLSPEDFWDQKGGDIIDVLYNCLDDRVYFNFQDRNSEDLNWDQDTQTPCIHITDTELNNQDNKEALELFLKNNPEAQVLLSVGDAFVQESVLSLGSDQVPSNLRDLSLLDPQGIVTSIWDYFLLSCSFLEHCDIIGLGNLTSIGDFFLFNCSFLEHFDTTGLSNLTSIGILFLSRTPLQAQEIKEAILERNS